MMVQHTAQARQRQQGSTLLIAMIFLLLFLVIATAVYRTSLTSTQAIGNMQWRNEAVNAADDAIDRLLSTSDFANNTAAMTAQVNAAPFQMDANGDGINDISVSFPVVTIDGVARAGPRCLRAEPIPNKDLDPDVAADVACYSTSSTGGGAPNAPSLCANTEWSITVRAVDGVTNTSVDVVQGVGVRVPTTAIPVCD
jgi:Tfp pilus assembly protein PilV